jgi:hypothetical protein
VLAIGLHIRFVRVATPTLSCDASRAGRERWAPTALRPSGVTRPLRTPRPSRSCRCPTSDFPASFRELTQAHSSRSQLRVFRISSSSSFFSSIQPSRAESLSVLSHRWTEFSVSIVVGRRLSILGVRIKAARWLILLSHLSTDKLRIRGTMGTSSPWRTL